MKPSEIIAKIYNKIRTYSGGNKNGDKIDAVIQYLDEIKPCQHLSSYLVDSVGDVFYSVCNDCGVLFLAKQNDEQR